MAYNIIPTPGDGILHLPLESDAALPLTVAMAM